MNSETNTKDKLSKEDIDKIFRGERPEGMDFEEFKMHRAGLKKHVNRYLQGQPYFNSSIIKEGKRVTKTFHKKDYDINK